MRWKIFAQLDLRMRSGQGGALSLPGQPGPHPTWHMSHGWENEQGKSLLSHWESDNEARAGSRGEKGWARCGAGESEGKSGRVPEAGQVEVQPGLWAL